MAAPTTYPAATHTDKWNMPTAFTDEQWPYYPTPCCNAAVSIDCDTATTYCKACYGEADPMLGGMPEAPYTPITKEAS